MNDILKKISSQPQKVTEQLLNNTKFVKLREQFNTITSKINKYEMDITSMLINRELFSMLGGNMTAIYAFNKAIKKPRAQTIAENSEPELRVLYYVLTNDNLISYTKPNWAVKSEVTVFSKSNIIRNFYVNELKLDLLVDEAQTNNIINKELVIKNMNNLLWLNDTSENIFELRKQLELVKMELDRIINLKRMEVLKA